jgi:hypothetical protein
MKNLFLAFMSFIMTITAVSAQISKTAKTRSEIYNIIERSKAANRANGIANPDHLDIGEQTSYNFEDGHVENHIVTKGETQSEIVEKMRILQKQHGGIVGYKLNPIPVPQPQPFTPVPVAQTTDKAVNLLIAVIIAFTFVLFVLIVRWFIRHSDPATSGRPMYEGGINRSNAERIAQENAQNQFPGLTISVNRIDVGTLDSNGKALRIGFANGPKRRVLRNEPGIRAEIMVGNETTPRIMYSLMRCGNDVRIGGGFYSNGIVFTATVTGSNIPVQREAAPAVNTGVTATGNPDADLFYQNLPQVVQQLVAAKTGFTIGYTPNPIAGQHTLSITALAPHTVLPNANSNHLLEAVTTEETVSAAN